MKILQVHARYRVRAGEDTVVDAEADALRAGGHEVQRLIVENPTSTGATFRALATSVHNRSVARRVGGEVAAFRPDVIHIHNTWFALSSSAISAAGATGCPVVMTLHNFRLGCLSTDLFRDGAVCTACIGRAPLAGVVHGCYRGSRFLSAVQATELMSTRVRGVLSEAVTSFVAPSRFMADRLADMGLPGDRLIVKPHFVDDPGARVAAPSAADTIVTIGRLAPGKGVGALLDAWNSVKPTRPARRLLVVGDGPEAARLRMQAPPSVEMPGWLDRDEVIALLLRARALVAPSELYETFGMVLVEAMSAGLPVIVTSAAGARDIVDAPNHLVVPPNDPVALARAIDTLDDAAVDAIGHANRVRFEQRYSLAVGIENLEALYRETIDRAQRVRA